MNDKETNYTLSKFSHEIRNPITLINSFLQLMTNEHPEMTTFNYYDKIQENMKLLRELLSELTDYNHAAQLHKQEMNLFYFLEEFAESAKYILKEDGIDIVVRKLTAVPKIQLDPVKINQLFNNLVRNSVEAILPGPGKISLEIACDGNDVIVDVRDTGDGITQEQMKDIFQPFVTYKRDGTGLGLAICDEIVRAHGGEISILSIPDGGTQFTILFPIS